MANNEKRFVARIVIEAQTPLKVGSSDVDMLQDAPIQKDFNDLPMIFGTSLAGVMRKHFDKATANTLFGDEEQVNSSKVIISNALLLDENKQVHEELLLNKSKFLKLFENLPVREHTTMTDKGVAKESSKFDEEVVYKGSRFAFRLEYIGDDEANFLTLIEALRADSFRLGGGTTKGFGDVKVVDNLSSYDVFGVTSQEYAQKSSSLNTTYEKLLPKMGKKEEDYIRYELRLTPDDFFMFGSGFGDDDADMTPVFEQVVNYEKKDLSEHKILIPASSIKGALSHRTAYHYNIQNDYFVGDANAKMTIVEIFGEAKDDGKGQKGKVLFSDCYLERSGEKVFDHVSIDRFTGGAIDGALFQEKAIADAENFTIEILLANGVVDEYREAFEKALTDIITGMLPLGGATTKGHGVFNGEIFKDGGAL